MSERVGGGPPWAHALERGGLGVGESVVPIPCAGEKKRMGMGDGLPTAALFHRTQRMVPMPSGYDNGLV